MRKYFCLIFGSNENFKICFRDYLTFNNCLGIEGDDLNFLLKDDLNFLMEWWFEFSFESLLRANVFSFMRSAYFNSFGDQSQICKDMLRALGFCFTLLYFAMLTSAKDSKRDGKCNYIAISCINLRMARVICLQSPIGLLARNTLSGY